MNPRSISPGYVVSRNDTDDDYALWRFDPDSDALFTALPGVRGRFDRQRSLIAIGGYFLWWGAMQEAAGSPFCEYRLVRYDPSSKDPLNAPPLQHGQWNQSKFWGRQADFGNPDGGHKELDRDRDLILISLGSYVLNFIANAGRGTFGVWSFDPNPTAPGAADPIPGDYPITSEGAFRDIQKGHELIAFDNYVLDRETATGRLRVWSFDPQAIIPLAHPPVQDCVRHDLGADHRLVAIGDHVVDWVPSTGQYRLYRFDPRSGDPLVGPLKAGKLPAELGPDATLMGFQPNAASATDSAPKPGTVEYLRKRIKHVVYYMLENRSFDHVVGWLHDRQAAIRVVGPAGPYDGASTDMYNLDGEKKVFLTKYKGGKLSTDYELEMFSYDPYHDCSDVLRQLFFARRDGYESGAVPDMGGFIWNNGSDQVMQTYTPEQLPVLNGLAKDYAISDRWFSSLPGPTDANRSFAITGSTQLQLNNFMSPPQYDYWPEQPHRASVFKLLWANGVTSFRIYNSTQWMKQVFTYELFLKGQIPAVDADVAKGGTTWIAPIDQFYDDALAGTLPAFSFLEPVWIGKSGTSSYHPGGDLIPGEAELEKIWSAIHHGPGWEETLLVITFDEHGGIFDHVPPPRAANPWPHDEVDGFRFDLMGVRVPTIVASPLIEPSTVFRSATGVEYDGTSFAATLLQWFGIPRERWFLGDRMAAAPTFENVVTRETPRDDAHDYELPYDKLFPPYGPPRPPRGVHPLHRHVANVLISSMARGKLAPSEIRALSEETLARGTTIDELTRELENLQKRLG